MNFLSFIYFFTLPWKLFLCKQIAAMCVRDAQTHHMEHPKSVSNLRICYDWLFVWSCKQLGETKKKKNCEAKRYKQKFLRPTKNFQVSKAKFNFEFSFYF